MNGILRACDFDFNLLEGMKWWNFSQLYANELNVENHKNSDDNSDLKRGTEDDDDDAGMS